MITKQNGIYTLIITLLFLSFQIKAATDYQIYEAVCGEPTDMFSFVDRGGIAINPCVVPPRNVLLGLGYQYQQLIGGGIQNNFPSSVIEVGFPDYFEVDLTLPSYINQTVAPRIGYSATQLDFKRILWFNSKWIASVNGTVIFPSGSSSFGSKGSGGGVTGILAYNINDQLNLTGTLEYISISEPINSGGQSYTSVNPDLLLSWTKNKISLFAEVYGQSKTAPDERSGYNADAGILYLIKKNIVIDLEIDQRISGLLDGVERYYGGGITIQFN
ncbi:TPA: transporter [Legionella pneumophila]|uniref:Transporter n=1 Tax=Legionella pneumophila TaxID=446 RepID=A0AAN5KRE5_LEGPN|nr:transporter [Legionella pneumophila]HAT1972721.1 transporter [Legionella pneumophila]HAT6956955.1 transporter [Legionella pneumophila]HEN4770548.1 transporter [Legionella pneumophila]